MTIALDTRTLCHIHFIPFPLSASLLLKAKSLRHWLMFDVLRGLSPVPDEEVLQLFGGTYHIPLQQDSGFYGKVRRLE